MVIKLNNASFFSISSFSADDEFDETVSDDYFNNRFSSFFSFFFSFFLDLNVLFFTSGWNEDSDSVVDPLFAIVSFNFFY